MNMKRVTKKECKVPKRYAINLLTFLQNELSAKYKFTYRLVGSAAWNTILKDKEGFYDLDYQILLTSNSKEYKTNNLTNPTQIKEDFFNCINKKLINDENIKVENSTTAITVINKKGKFSIDFVIIKLFPQNNLVIRRNNKEHSSINEYTWNKLPKQNEAYQKFRNLNNMQKIDLIENYILPRKAIEKEKDKNDNQKKPSCEIFIEEVNNYVARNS